MGTMESFRFDSAIDGATIQAYVWPAAGKPRAIVSISHGAAEHALRYERFALALNAVGIEVWATDHRGHGQSPGPHGLGDFGEGGWLALVADMGQLIDLARKAQPDTPVILFGHSMGSFAAQEFCLDESERIDALILSGSTALEVPGEDGPAPAGGFNAALEPARTEYDWLSRDEAEVDKYIADPLCGFETLGWRGTRSLWDPTRLADAEALRNIRSDLPVLLMAGERDPINNDLKGLHLLEQRWRDAGVERIDTQYYEGARHETLNEINRDEVTDNIIDWLNDILQHLS